MPVIYGDDLGNVFQLDNSYTVFGYDGGDFLDAGVMYGGKGSDQYKVDNANDKVIEKTNEGFRDTVFSHIKSYTLTENIEWLSLEGESARTGIGNGIDNTIFGNNHNNKLDGKGGNDRLFGDRGNDTLIGGGGSDYLMGFGSIPGSAWTGYRPVYGYGEKDILTGGSGRDTFVLGGDGSVAYTDLLRGSLGLNDYALIRDFNVKEDRIQLAKSIDQYVFDRSPIGVGSTAQDTGIFYVGDGTRELIGIIQDFRPDQLTQQNFEFI